MKLKHLQKLLADYNQKQGQKLSTRTQVKAVKRSEILKVKNHKTSQYHKSDNSGHIQFYRKAVSS